ncbi:MAG: 1-acyl-sn-glycerol-3-phosphate acyltransferase [Actinomycetia bacterium]|nr:1-acyl-sn-glycerol-3-phosphate acyltransferase [Actinomycetes bacterium]
MLKLKEKILEFFYSIPRVLFINFFKLFVRIRVFSLENIPDDRSAILAINHTTGADPIVLLGAVDKKIYFMASARNFGTRFTNFFMRRFTNSLPVFQEKPIKNTATFRELFSIAKRDNVLVGIFPEGKLNKKGKLESFHNGAAYLSFKTRLPIIPVYMHNLRKGASSKSFFARSNVAEGIISIIANTFRRINVFIGDPINPTAEEIANDFRDLVDTKSYRAAIDDINRALIKAFSELEEEAGGVFTPDDDSVDPLQHPLPDKPGGLFEN